MHLTARGYHRVLRVARAIADLDGVAQIRRAHIAEALSFRRIAPERRLPAGDALAASPCSASVVAAVRSWSLAVRAKARWSDLYERDLYAWSEVQADLLRRRRFAELDLEHIVEEIEDAGGSLYREVRSRIRTIIEHLLKLEHSMAGEPRAGWERTIRHERADPAEDLTPSVQARIERGLARFYAAARIEAAVALSAHGEEAAADALPTTCPYSLDQLTGDWLPGQTRGNEASTGS
jgi:hypothetical protein